MEVLELGFLEKGKNVVGGEQVEARGAGLVLAHHGIGLSTASLAICEAADLGSVES